MAEIQMEFYCRWAEALVLGFFSLVLNFTLVFVNYFTLRGVLKLFKSCHQDSSEGSSTCIENSSTLRQFASPSPTLYRAPCPGVEMCSS